MDARLIEALRHIDGVERSASMFGSDDAFRCNGKEIAHLDGPGAVDVRLTRAVIKEMRPALRDDPRVTFRRGTSDWVEVRCTADDDVELAVALVERSAAAHRAPAGQAPKPPPTRAELERRRRFH